MNAPGRMATNFKSATAVKFGLAFGLLGACLIVDAVLGSSHASSSVLFGVAAAGLVVGGGVVLRHCAKVAHGTRLQHRAAGCDPTSRSRRTSSTASEALANGDLTVHLEAKTKAIEPDQRGDDLGELSRATESMRALFLECYVDYNQATEKLRDLVARVSSTARSVGDSSRPDGGHLG